jgi:tRNA(Ile)-lysidine synthase
LALKFVGITRTVILTGIPRPFIGFAEIALPLPSPIWKSSKFMHPLAKKVLGLISRENLIVSGEAVVIGVSGGADSMALLRVLADLRPELNMVLTAVYVDHGLRPLETGQEAELVARTAAVLEVDCRIDTVDVKGEAGRRKLSTEHAARLLRYHSLERVAAELGGAKIAVAHTADDQAEELLIRLVRGTGRAGLAGMKTLRDGRIIRPFLGIAKEELLIFLQEMRLGWLEDSSNGQRKFLRNRVRLDLLPYLAEHFNSGIRQTLTRTAAILQDEEELFASLARQAGERVRIATRPEEGPAIEFLLDPFRCEPKAMQRRLIESACLELGHSPSFREIEQVLRLAAKGSNGFRLHLRAGLRVARCGDRLRFFYPQGRGARRGD